MAKRLSKSITRDLALDTQLEPNLDEYEASRITGRSVASLRRDRLLRQGLPFVKWGRLVRYRPSDIRAHQAANLYGDKAQQ
jgi:hypothetical protein